LIPHAMQFILEWWLPVEQPPEEFAYDYL
jgi:hypothetical protein